MHVSSAISTDFGNPEFPAFLSISPTKNIRVIA
jgi:hypothetical protein